MEGSNNKPGGAITWIALAVFSAILMLVLVFSEPAYSAFCAFSEKSGSSCLRDLVSEFQTLITGLAAVMAASATIYIMQRTDAAQDLRHRELVQLTLRSDRLKVERALVPQAAELQRIQMTIDHRIAQATYGRQGASFRVAVADLARALMQALVICEKIIDREAFLDGSKLFDGSLSAAIHRFRTQIGPVKQRCTHSAKTLSDGRTSSQEQPWTESELDFLALKTIRDASEVSNELAAMVEGFRRLARGYTLEIENAPNQ